MTDFRKLKVWHAARALAIDAHHLTKRMRGASSATRDQLTRAAMSVPANIVEGSAHSSPREFARYLRYAVASTSEVEGHAQLAHDLDMISAEDLASLCERTVQTRKMLHGLLKRLS